MVSSNNITYVMHEDIACPFKQNCYDDNAAPVDVVYMDGLVQDCSISIATTVLH